MSTNWTVHRDRADRVQMALDYVDRRVAELQSDYPHSTVTVDAESRSDPGAIVGREDWWGTADITITCTAPDGSINFLEICDYKDGRGFVDPTNNPQLISYLSGKLGDTYVADCRISIVQPKTHPPIRYHDINPDEVRRIHASMAVAAALTDDPLAPLSRGKWCKWCKHKPNCTEHRAMNLELLNLGMLTISESDLALVLDMREKIIATLDIAKVEAITRLTKDIPISGYALGKGNSRQTWAEDEEEIVKILKSRKFKLTDIYPPKLISPAQVMKLDMLTDTQKETLKKKCINVTKGKPTLVAVEKISFI